MITKTKPAHVRYFPDACQLPGSSWAKYSRTEGSDTIVYDAGPKVRDGHNVWKRCSHVTNGVYKGTSPYVAVARNGDRYGWAFQMAPSSWSPGSYTLECPSVGEVAKDFWDQVDLNCHDSVLLYSGILQAVPLVGGAFTFVKVMNRLGRKLSKDFRKKPFTTVLKSAISLDFIDRFVVSPTIDDARKFLDAHNYVIRVLNTAYERNGLMPTCYESQSSNSRTISSSSANRRSSWSGFTATFPCTMTRTESATTKTMVLAETRYNTDAIDPIKLWATRIGITRPLDSVWDLVPFSFVVDYFSRAGDFIAGLGSELTDQDGLRGNVQKIYGSWFTQKRSFLQVEEYGLPSVNIRPGTGYWDFNYVGPRTPGYFTYEISTFARDTFNPYESLARDPHGFLRLDLSLVRGRTLAELFIQSKLR